MCMKQRPRNLKKSRERCLCGLRAALHFTLDNHKLSCDEARRLHPRATVRPGALLDALQASIDKALSPIRAQLAAYQREESRRADDEYFKSGTRYQGQ